MSAAYFTELFTALSPIVGGRVYPVKFPQEPLPTWPAIRYTPEGGPTEKTNCGDVDSPDIPVQIDVVAKNFLDLLPLAESVKTAMSTFSVPVVLENDAGFTYDHETKTHRAILQFTIAGSSNF